MNGNLPEFFNDSSVSSPYSLFPFLIHSSLLIKTHFSLFTTQLTPGSTIHYSGAELVYGDVCEIDSLVSASKNCSTIVSVHGMKPARFSKITDLFVSPSNIPYHPYNINYLGVRRILTAMEINKCDKIVRITGSLVDKSAFKPFKVLFNGLLSMTGTASLPLICENNRRTCFSVYFSFSPLFPFFSFFLFSFIF